MARMGADDVTERNESVQFSGKIARRFNYTIASVQGYIDQLADAYEVSDGNLRIKGFNIAIGCPWCRRGAFAFAPVKETSKCNLCHKELSLDQVAEVYAERARMEAETELTMRHDSHKRVGGAIRQTRHG